MFHPVVLLYADTNHQLPNTASLARDLKNFLISVSNTDENSLRAGRSGDRIVVAARFSAPDHTGPGAQPAFCTIGTVFFPEGKEWNWLHPNLHNRRSPT